MKTSFFCLSFLFLFFFTQARGQIRLSGSIDAIEKGRFMLLDVLGKGDTLADTQFDNFKFETDCRYPQGKIKRIAAVSYIIRHEAGLLSGIFFLENNPKVSFKYPKDKPFLEHYGSKNADIMTNFFTETMPFYGEYENALQEKNEANLYAVKTKISDYAYTFTKKYIDTDLNEFVLTYLQRFIEIDVIHNKHLVYYKDLSAKYKDNTKIASMLYTQIEGKLSITVGKPAYNFTLPDTEGKAIELKSIQSSYILLDFWATWCAPCIKSMPKLKKIQQRYPEVTIMSISSDKDKDAWKKCIKKHGMTWCNVHDENYLVTNAYLAYAIPYYVLMDKDKNIVLITNDVDEVEKILKK